MVISQWPRSGVLLSRAFFAVHGCIGSMGRPMLSRPLERSNPNSLRAFPSGRLESFFRA